MLSSAIAVALMATAATAQAPKSLNADGDATTTALFRDVTPLPPQTHQGSFFLRPPPFSNPGPPATPLWPGDFQPRGTPMGHSSAFTRATEPNLVPGMHAPIYAGTPYTAAPTFATPLAFSARAPPGWQPQPALADIMASAVQHTAARVGVDATTSGQLVTAVISPGQFSPSEPLAAADAFTSRGGLNGDFTRADVPCAIPAAGNCHHHLESGAAMRQQLWSSTAPVPEVCNVSVTALARSPRRSSSDVFASKVLLSSPDPLITEISSTPAAEHWSPADVVAAAMQSASTSPDHRASTPTTASPPGSTPRFLQRAEFPAAETPSFLCIPVVNL